jgi:hypothetical protein
VQAAQLQHDEEQEEDDRAAGVLEILPLLSEAHVAQRVEIMRTAECGMRNPEIQEFRLSFRIPPSAFRIG